MTDSSNGATAPILLAFSGGLDTSFLVPWLKETYGRPVVTLTVDNRRHRRRGRARAREPLQGPRRGGAPPVRRAQGLLRHRAALPGDGQRPPRPALPAVRRRGTRHAGADHRAGWRTSVSAPPLVAHGCTAAGNDQVRFEVALRTHRAGAWRSSRRSATTGLQAPRAVEAYLEDRKLPGPAVWRPPIRSTAACGV